MLRRLLAMILGALGLPPSVPTPPVPVTPPSSGGLVAEINAARVANRLAPLVEDARLSAAAGDHAADLSRTGRMSHIGSDGSSFVDRARRRGFSMPFGEVVAAGQTSDRQAVLDWLASPGHRAVLLDPAARVVGAAGVGTFRVAVTGGVR